MLSMRFHTVINPTHFTFSVFINFSMVPQIGIVEKEYRKERNTI